jgi:hypothetical protein
MNFIMPVFSVDFGHEKKENLIVVWIVVTVVVVSPFEESAFTNSYPCE